MTMKQKMKKMMSYRVWEFLASQYRYWKRFPALLPLIFRRESDAFAILIGTPEHGNLGDHAIAVAEKEFLATYFPDYKVLELTGQHFRYAKTRLPSKLRPDDLIIINGGGSLGDLWILDEIIVRDAIDLFPNHRIVIMPQTIFFTGDIAHNEEYQLSKMSYLSHDNFLICARDKASCQLLQTMTRGVKENKCIFVPDIVTYLDCEKQCIHREGALLCFRQDKEKVISDENITSMEATLQKLFSTVKHTDTVLLYDITIPQRDFELERKLDEFCDASLVITDRLHGMLFAAITKTPCIAFDNLSHKVTGVFEWIKSLEYIVCIETIDELPDAIEKVMRMTDKKSCRELLLHEFETLAKEI